MRRQSFPEFLCSVVAVILFATTISLSQSGMAADASRQLVGPSDRLVLVGPTMIERMQRYGYLDTLLAQRTAGKLQTRNLGWSGDTVFGISRAVFGTQEVGFSRLVNDVVQAKPTVVLLAYGRNEALKGPAGEAAFEKQYRLLAATLVEKTKARLILLQPRKVEWLGPPLPAPAAWNGNLDRYRHIIRNIANDMQASLIESTATDHWTITSNGLHPTNAGFWKYSFWLADQLIPSPAAPTWEVSTSPDSPVQAKQLTKVAYQFTIEGPLPPPDGPAGVANQRLSTIKIDGLPEGEYQLSNNGVPLKTATAKNWKHGLSVAAPFGAVQTEKIRQLAIAKNQLYFHRYRPQNETYLFLFRKHEQGNNAVEIPQYEPLVAALEQQIAKLARPIATVYRLAKIR
jgi:lysophospholipase L1-like esterase